MTKGILYYTDNELDERLFKTCQKYIQKSGLPITSVSLKPIDLGKNIVVSESRSRETMSRQILRGLEEMTEDVIFFCEHDVLYHPLHFKFEPENSRIFYYNENYWCVRLSDGFAVHYDMIPLSGLVVGREAALIHFKERNVYIAKKGFGIGRIGFEPFRQTKIQWNSQFSVEYFCPSFPNIDIGHGKNTTLKRWNQTRFRKKPLFWEESTVKNIPGWPNLPEILRINN